MSLVQRRGRIALGGSGTCDRPFPVKLAKPFLASTNKSLAQSNKSSDRSSATKERKVDPVNLAYGLCRHSVEILLRRMIMELFTQIQYEKKLQLIRKLLEERSKRSMFLRLFSNVQTMPDTVVMLTPEGTIVTIVETYYALRKAGASAAEALAAIENFRSMSTPGGTPNCSDLNAYVQYRVRLEHNRGRQMTDFEILRASSITSDFIEKFLGAGPVEEVASEDKSAHPYFMSELPHPEVNHPAGVFRTGEAMLF